MASALGLTILQFCEFSVLIIAAVMRFEMLSDPDRELK